MEEVNGSVKSSLETKLFLYARVQNYHGMKGYPDLTNIPQNCHVSGDGSVMSGGDAPPPGGRGYPHHLPPTVAPPPGGGPPQRSVRHQQPPPWPAHNPVGGMVGGFYGDPHIGGVRGGQWQAKPGNQLFGLPASLVSQEVATSPQSESIDLSAPRGGTTGGNQATPLLRNGEKSPVNGQVKEAAVSVIAPNPLREEMDINVNYGHQSTVTVPQPPPAPLQQFLGVRGAGEGLSPAAPAPKEEPPAEVALMAQDAPPMSRDTEPLIKESAIEVKVKEEDDVPPHADEGQIAAVPEDSAKEAKSEEVPPEVASLGATEAALTTPPKGAIDVDRVESLLENMFQGGNDEAPIPQSVIVSNCARQPALTEDRVVAILEDKVDEVKAPILDSQVDEKMEVVAKEVKEDGGEKFTQVESELEKMFAGIVEPTDDSKSCPEVKPLPQQPSGDTVARKGKKRSLTSKPKPGRKLSDNGKRSKKRGGSLSGSDRKAKRPKLNSSGLRITKEGSNDSSMMGGGAGSSSQQAGGNSGGRLRGPYVHIEGNRDNPRYVSVVNGGTREEEERERGGVDKSSTAVRRKTQLQHHTEGRLKGPGLYSSTLSARYNSNNIDATWVCVFCKQRPHCERGLGGEPAGDLFGPYMLNIVAGGNGDLPPAGTPSDREVAEEQKRKGGGRQLSLRTAGVAQQFANSYAKKSKLQQRHSGDSGVDSCGSGGMQEVWVHEQCAVWAPGVVIVGSHLIGLEEAVSAASVTKCSHCGVKGAGLGCVVRGCATRCHYGCALATRWHLNNETFIAKCPNHTLPTAPQGYVSLAMLKGTA